MCGSILRRGRRLLGSDEWGGRWLAKKAVASVEWLVARSTSNILEFSHRVRSSRLRETHRNAKDLTQSAQRKSENTEKGNGTQPGVAVPRANREIGVPRGARLKLWQAGAQQAAPLPWLRVDVALDGD